MSAFKVKKMAIVNGLDAEIAKEGSGSEGKSVKTSRELKKPLESGGAGDHPGADTAGSTGCSGEIIIHKLA
jgi:hypothetical protein